MSASLMSSGFLNANSESNCSSSNLAERTKTLPSSSTFAKGSPSKGGSVSYTHLRAHET